MNINNIKYFIFCLGIITVVGVLFYFFYPRDNNLAQAEIVKVGEIKSNILKVQLNNQNYNDGTWLDVSRVSDEIYKYYPLSVGNKWEYGGQEKTIISSKTIQGSSDFTEVVKYIKQRDSTFVVSIDHCKGKQNVTFPGNCHEDLLYINGNKICDDIDCKETYLEFPLVVQTVMDSESYKNRVEMGIDDKMYVWYINNKVSLNIFGQKNSNCFEVEYFALPDEETDIFCYGVGFVQKYYNHNGTLDIIDEKLINFIEAN